MAKIKSAPELPFTIEQVASRDMVRSITKNADGLRKMDLDLIKIRPGFNYRIKPEGLDEELWEQVLGIARLADGIFASNGPADPILGDILPQGYFYQTDGERRIRALRHLVKTGRDIYPNGQPVSEVRILLNPSGTTELDRKIKIGTTNDNMPLKPMERARYYKSFVDSEELTHQQIADLFPSISRQTIDNYILANSLPEEVQTAIEEERISISQALKEHREKNKKKTKDDGLPIDEKPTTVKKELDGDEDEIEQRDNSITFPGSMGGPKETSGQAIGKDGTYQDKEKVALWKQLFNRIMVLKEKNISSFVVNATFEELDALDAHVIDIIKNEYLLTLK